MMEKFPHSEGEMRSFEEKIKSLGEKLGRELEISHTPDTITVAVVKENGEKVEMGFIRTEKIPIDYGTSYVKLEEMIEARLRFPESDPGTALQKTKELKEKGV
jgi:hypothetical protein